MKYYIIVKNTMGKNSKLGQNYVTITTDPHIAEEEKNFADEVIEAVGLNISLSL